MFFRFVFKNELELHVLFMLLSNLDVVEELYGHLHPLTGSHQPLVSTNFYQVVKDNSEKINSVINFDQDFDITYFGFKVCLTLMY